MLKVFVCTACRVVSPTRGKPGSKVGLKNDHPFSTQYFYHFPLLSEESTHHHVKPSKSAPSRFTAIEEEEGDVESTNM